MPRARRGGRASDEFRRPLEGVFPSKLTRWMRGDRIRRTTGMMNKKTTKSRPAAPPGRNRRLRVRKKIPYRKPELERKDSVVPFAPEANPFPEPILPGAGRPKN